MVTGASASNEAIERYSQSTKERQVFGIGSGITSHRLVTIKTYSSLNQDVAITSSGNLVGNMSGLRVGLRSIKALKRQKLFIAKLQTPEWLPITQRAWELSGYVHHSSWTISMRTWVEVDMDSEVMRCVGDGDIPKLQNLLQEEKASLYSVGWPSLTLLDVSGMYLL